MKNTLLTTTALAMTAGAAFADGHAVNVKVGGFFHPAIGIASVDAENNDGSADFGDFDGLDVQTNAEIIFSPSVTLDNGIKIGAQIQLEGNTSGDQIDESFFSITGDFGRVLIGSENSAGYLMHVAAPDVSPLFAHSSSLTAFVPYSGTLNQGDNTVDQATGDAIDVDGDDVELGDNIFRGTLGTTAIENGGNNDAQRITYFTPRFGGLQLGVSYARDGGQGNGPVNNDNTLTDLIDIGANYGGEFGGVSINASARYGIADASGSGDDPEIWAAGLNLGFGGFTIGGSYAEQDDAGDADGSAYDIGVSYANGPMAYSLTYFSGENVDNDAALTAGEEETLDTIVLAARYTVNSNFSVSAFIANTEFEEEAATGQTVDGTIVGIGAKFSF